jgi:hypothetical protein
MNHLVILVFLAAFMMGYKYCSNELKSPFMVTFAFIIIYLMYSKYGPKKTNTKEGFESENDSRVVKYGDIITLWSPSVNKFIQADPTVGNKMSKLPLGKINLSNSLISSEDIPSSMDWVHFMVIDGRDPGDIGNSGSIKFGSTVYLKTVHYMDGKFIPTYVSPNKDNTVYMSTERYEGDSNKAEQQVVFESATGLQDSDIHYGDMLLIKTWRTDMPYIHVSRSNDVVLSNSSAITRNFYIYDKNGQGKNIDWARIGTTNQSSTNNNLYSQFAIDGNLLTYSSTSKEDKPWWEVILPNDVIISRIIVSNTTDTSVSTLEKFDIKLLDFDNTLIDTKKFGGNSQTKYNWENVNQIGRKIRIELAKTDQLNIADVRVYGQVVNYSVLLNEEMSKNLIFSKTLTPKTDIYFKHRTLPRVTKDMTIMFLLELEKLPKEVSNIFIKSKNVEENRTPNLLINPPKKNTNFATLQYIVSTEAGNNEMGENFLIDYNVLPNKKFHFTGVHNAGINKANGWAPCKFNTTNGDYICNFSTRELYKIVLSESEEFKKETVIELDDPKNYGFRMKGLYNDELSIATIQIFINGLLNTTYQIKSNIKQNTDILTIGAFKKYPGVEGEISFFKFSNRVIPEEYIQKESQILTGKISMQLLSTSTLVSTQTIVKIDPNYLPDISSNHPQYSIQLWINSQRPITGTGNDEPIIQYGKEGIFFYSDKNSIYTKTNTGDVGIEDCNFKIPVDQWIHLVYVVKDNNTSMFINGKKTATKANGPKDTKKNSFAIINIGGFNGFVNNVQFSNYGLSDADIKTSLLANPNNDAFGVVRSAFKKSGCIADPIDVNDPYVDNYNSSWITFANKKEDSKLTQSIIDFKKLADEGIQTEDIIKLKLAEKCYGKDDTSTRVELNRNKKMLKESETKKDSIKCLPKAPFTCKKYNIDDFDIRTHKEFPKYIDKSKVRQAPKPVDRVTQLPPDPTKYLSKELVESQFVEKSKIKENPDYINMKEKLDQMTVQIKEMNKLKELVSKCQSNTDKITKMEKYIEDLKKISKSNPQDQTISKQLEKLDKEMTLTNKTADKDAQELLGNLSLTGMVSKKAELDKEFDFLKRDKDNIELQNIQNRMANTTGRCASDTLKHSVENTISGLSNTKNNGIISGLDKSQRIIPGINISKNQKIAVNSDGKQWLEKQMIDLDKIDKMVKNDLKQIEGKLDKINQKITNKNMTQLEVANLTNHITSIKQNELASK